MGRTSGQESTADRTRDRMSTAERTRDRRVHDERTMTDSEDPGTVQASCSSAQHSNHAAASAASVCMLSLLQRVLRLDLQGVCTSAVHNLCGRCGSDGEYVEYLWLVWNVSCSKCTMARLTTKCVVYSRKSLAPPINLAGRGGEYVQSWPGHCECCLSAPSVLLARLMKGYAHLQFAICLEGQSASESRVAGLTQSLHRRPP